jgi:hypothetical protein
MLYFKESRIRDLGEISYIGVYFVECKKQRGRHANVFCCESDANT